MSSSASSPLTRRDALGAAGVAAASLALTACGHPSTAAAPTGGGAAGSAAATSAAGSASTSTEAPAPLPTVYLPHGGGPWPFVSEPLGDPEELARLSTYLRDLAHVSSTPPRAILVISAHWEAPTATVMSAAAPPLLYDYYGFPDEAYRVTWPAPGAPDVAARVRALLTEAGLPSAEDPARGFDHGTFVPLKLAWPAANIPTLQLSLVRGLDPATHLAVGRALTPLRREGVLIVGSGMSYHNMRGFGAVLSGRRPAHAPPLGADFDAWLRVTATLPTAERDTRLARWTEAPGARDAHPREEHLLPLMVIAGAAGEDVGRVAYSETLLGSAVSALHFG